MPVILRGIVLSGTGEGARYVELYRDLLAQALGLNPYPGTLNISLEKCFYELVDMNRLITIQPPRPGLREVLVCRGYFVDVPVLVLKPLATKHGCNVVEVVSHVNLRRELGIRDGDVVELTLLC